MYNHEREMEKLYEMYSSGILSAHHTHNVGHIAVIGHNPATKTPVKPPTPTPPSPIPPTPSPTPPSPGPPGEHHHKKHHKDNYWDIFKKGFEEGGSVIADTFDPYKDHGSSGLDIHTGN